MFGVVWDQKKSIFDVVWGIKSIQFKKIAADKLRDRTSLGGLTRTRQAVSWSQPSFKSMLDTSRTSAEPSRLACWVVIYTVEVGLSWCETSLNASPPDKPSPTFFASGEKRGPEGLEAKWWVYAADILSQILHNLYPFGWWCGPTVGLFHVIYLIQTKLNMCNIWQVVVKNCD